MGGQGLILLRKGEEYVLHERVNTSRPNYSRATNSIRRRALLHLAQKVHSLLFRLISIYVVGKRCLHLRGGHL